MSDSERRRLSLPGVLLVLAILAGLGGLGFVAWDYGSTTAERLTAKSPNTWLAPYVDVTISPIHSFEDPQTGPASAAALGFVVPDPRQPCTPTWGTFYDLDGAGSALDLDRRIARLRERGGDVLISFGGVVNSELAVSCTDQDKLTEAYRSVVTRYEASTIDLDIEGAALQDAAANQRRAVAVRKLQDEAPEDRPLQVWLTLPVTPGGLQPDGEAVLDATLDGGVELAGVNVMTMNFGGSKPADMSMGDAAIAALRATHEQLIAAYRRTGQTLTPEQAWARLGGTPMVGHNDVAPEVFTLEDAGRLASFADEKRLGRVSLWSANRDAPCASGEGRQVSGTCSGVDQEPLDFTWRLLGPLDAEVPVRTPPPAALDDGTARVADDPKLSPYPIWRPNRTYREGEKVVWQRTVYEAKWWTRGNTPDEPFDNEWDTAWRNVGPVLPSDFDEEQARAASSPSSWSTNVVYGRGERVRYQGFLYEAKWLHQDVVPDLDPARPGSFPWRVVGRAVGDLPPVFERHLPWRPRVTYTVGDRVSLDGFVFEARRRSRGAKPERKPAEPTRSAWQLVGKVAEPR